MGKFGLLRTVCMISVVCAATAIASSAQSFRTLHNFDRTDGVEPFGLVLAADGNFYGTTSYGGTSSSNCGNGCGTVFKITPTGVLTTLHAFDWTDGYFPSPLVLAADGNFYGTTTYGGTSSNPNCSLGCGTVFKITPTGVEPVRSGDVPPSYSSKQLHGYILFIADV